MCMSCGCGEPDNDHGNPDHITRAEMERAARAAGVDIEQAADNIHASAHTLTGKTGSGSQGSDQGGGMTQAGSLGSSGGTLGSSAATDDAGTRQDRGVRS